MANAAGESQEPHLRLGFDRRIKLEFHGARISSDGGLIAYRELDGALGLTDLAASVLDDGRRGRNIRHKLPSLVRQAVLGRLAGYEDVNDAERLADDPVIVSIGMDSSVSPTYGGQQGTACNGHFGCTCYHPLFLFNQYGDLERCLLRSGDAHSAEDWRLVLEPVIARYRERGIDLYFRADAAFAKPELYERLEAEGIRYAIRLPANRVLQQCIAHLLTRPVGRPPNKPQVFVASFS